MSDHDNVQTGPPQSSPAHPSERAPADAPTVPPLLAKLAIDGPFRQALLAWFGDSPERRALDFVGQLLERSLASLPAPEGDPLPARLKAIAADLDFLAHFLSYGVDGRHGTTLEAKDWEPARTGGLAGATVSGWLVQLREATGEPETTLTPTTWEQVVAVRETALWRVADSVQAQAMRDLGRILSAGGRELRPVEDSHEGGCWPLPPDASSTLRDTLAAAADLLHLAAFTAATADEVPEDKPLHGLLDALAYRMARMVETLCAGLEAGTRQDLPEV